ncbi:MAG TPA: GGDEF domain-containing protein [Acidimicrobiales bacterium]|nr:GGDEF domain-containing protein [Acidimicrobiales bacterium]
MPADRLLQVAAALSEGAARLHSSLARLDPEERAAVLELVTAQVSTVVSLYGDLVHSVVDAEPPRSAHLAPVVETPAPRPPATARPESRPPLEVPDDQPLRPYRRSTGRDEGQGALTRDELTGVLNRHAGFTALQREIDRAQRDGTAFIIGYLNVDGLRAVNETNGPRSGDELLRKVAAALRATLRSYDVIMRLGGDEFLFSLPGADMDTAEQRLKEFTVILAEDAPGSTATVGFAELGQGDDLDQLVARADAALAERRRNRSR